jgi:MSHA biogenesis protein MshP
MRSTSTTCPSAGAARRRPGARRTGRARHTRRGFTLISAIFIVVVLAALGTAIAAISQRQHLGTATELQHARALQAARAGLEWAAFQVLRSPAPPAPAPACPAPVSFVPADLGGFTVTVSCASSTGTDGPETLTFYQLVANACNAPAGGGCPAATKTEPTYVERQLSWTVMR